MHCPRCRTPAGDDARSCPACSAPLTWLVLMPDGERTGPYSAEELTAGIANGRVPPTAYVIQEATGIQMPLSRAGFVPADAPAPAANVPLPRARDRTAWVAAAIVIGIIVLLVGLATAVIAPLVGRARRNARQTACIRNASQLAYACLMYSQDHNGRLPPAGDPQTLQSALLPYAGAPSVFVCPDAPDEPGYRLNPNLAGEDVNAVPQPAAQWPMLWDAGASVGGIPPIPGATPTRHNGAAVVAYADGHIRWHPAGMVEGLAPDPFARPSPGGASPGARSSAVR